MIRSNIPSLDLHGENRDSARVLVNEFIKDNCKLKNNMIVIVHGIGTGILKKEVHSILKINKNVKKYYLDNFNIGCTIVELYDTIDKI